MRACLRACLSAAAAPLSAFAAALAAVSLGSGAPRDEAARVSTAEVSFNRHVGAALELAQLVRRCGCGGCGNFRERSLADTRRRGVARRWRWRTRSRASSAWTTRRALRRFPRFSARRQLLAATLKTCRGGAAAQVALRREARRRAKARSLAPVADGETQEAAAAYAVRGGDVPRASAELARRAKFRGSDAATPARARLAALLAYSQWCGERQRAVSASKHQR
jgi:hypothetical protein